MKKIAVLMDSIYHIHLEKDTSIALLFEAQARGFELWVFDDKDMFVEQGEVFAKTKLITVSKGDEWFGVLEQKTINLSEFAYIFMRKDPPFNMNYIYVTYMLEIAESKGVRVINKPSSLRNFNEKMFITKFPELITDTLVGSNAKLIHEFFQKHKTIILKPLDNMGGTDVFKHIEGDDIQPTISYLTKNRTPIMVQKFIPEITEGDKRIILINGQPIDYCLARIPAEGNFKGNLAAGALGIGQKMSDRDYYLCEQIAPILKDNGLAFVGVDVIGDYISEINVTSPTGVRELDREFNLNIAGVLFDYLDSIDY